MARLLSFIAFAIGCAAAQGAVVSDADHIASYLAARPQTAFFLPKLLDEVSGVTPATDGSVYAHNDEFGIVYEIDLATGKVLRAFALGTPTVKGDFEDIAARGNRVYLLRSDGLIFEARQGQHRGRVLFNVYDTGVGKRCETEGLVKGPGESDFLILCKKIIDEFLKGHLVIFRWSLDERGSPAEPWMNISLDGILKSSAQGDFHPSAFAWNPDTRTYFIVSAKDHNAIEIDSEGRFINRYKVDKDLHPQPEALTVMPDGRLVIADEGLRGHAKITVYALPRRFPAAASVATP